MLKPEVSIPVAMALGAVVIGVYSNVTPNLSDIRTVDQFDKDVDATRKQAAWTSAGLVAAISLLAKDPTIFTVGGVIVIIMDWSHRHADMVNPITQRATSLLSIGEMTPEVTQEDAPQDYGYPGDTSSLPVM